MLEESYEGSMVGNTRVFKQVGKMYNTEGIKDQRKKSTWRELLDVAIENYLLMIDHIIYYPNWNTFERIRRGY